MSDPIEDEKDEFYTDFMERPSKIVDRLWIGNRQSIQKDFIESSDIGLLINVSKEVPDPVNLPEHVQHVRVPVLDDLNADLSRYFQRISQTIKQYLEANPGYGVLVFCVHGISRSVSMVIAYLVKYNNMTLKEAYEHVYQQRRICRPNRNFLRQLINFEKTVKGKNSTKIIFVSRDQFGAFVPDFYMEKIYSKVLILEMMCQRIPVNNQQDRIELPASTDHSDN